MLHLFKKGNKTNDLSQQDWTTKLEATDDAVIVDVRAPQECRSGMIKGALNVNFFSPDFKQQINSLDKDKTYFVYCRSGNRSGKACAIMMNSGFHSAYNLVGGMMQWQGEVV